MKTSAATPPRAHAPLRADAARNRERVLEAAARLFREHGLDVTMREVAEEAGVGVGTVSRRFSSKDELVAALVEQRFERLLALLRGAAARMEVDPWGAFAQVFTDAVELHVRDRGFIEAIADARADAGRACTARRGELLAVLEEIVARAIAAGVVRADLTATDIPQLACMVSRTSASTAGPIQPDAWRRACEVVLDGMRAR